MTSYYILALAILVILALVFIFRMRMVLIFLLCFVTVVAVRTSLFVVNEGSQAVITQFGKIIGQPYTKAGVYFKVPLLWKVNYFDKRIQTEIEQQEGVATKDGYFIALDTVFNWQISDPSLYIESIGNMENAEAMLKNIVSGSVRETISSYNLLDTIRSQAFSANDQQQNDRQPEAKSARELLGIDSQITAGREMLSSIMTHDANSYTQKYGISVIKVLIRDIRYEPSVEQIIFRRMVSGRLREAARLRAAGRSKALEINGEMEKQYQEIMAPAMKTALTIKGEAEAEATKRYGFAYRQDREFYNFWRTLAIYSQNLPTHSQGILFSMDSPLLKLLSSGSGLANTATLPLNKQ